MWAGGIQDGSGSGLMSDIEAEKNEDPLNNRGVEWIEGEHVARFLHLLPILTNESFEKDINI